MRDTKLIDRQAAINYFTNMIDGSSGKRILRITGPEKMGKSRIVREYYRLSREQWKAQCTLVDLRSKLQNCDDILFNVAQQIGIAYFPKYQSIQNQYVAPRLDFSRLSQFFSVLNVDAEHDKSSEEQYRRRITAAFVQDVQVMPSNIPIVLLFDAFEEATNYIKDWLNEQLISGLIRLPNVYIVTAGRTLPDAPQTWLDSSHTYDLPPVLFEDQKDYCARAGINLADEVILAFHEAFEGRPGLFAEYTTKALQKNYFSDSSTKRAKNRRESQVATVKTEKLFFGSA